MTPEQLEEMNSIRWWHRIELEPGLFSPGEVRHGPDGGDFPTTRFGIPKDLTGKTVLDVGSWDGFFAFECEKRGAKVTAADCTLEEGGNWGGTKGFEFAKKILKSKVEYKHLDISKGDPSLGKFDITLHYGVLYHVHDMMAVLKNTFDLTKEFTLLETATLPKNQDINPKIPLAGFNPGFANDPTNYWYPNLKCLEMMLIGAGYSKVEVIYQDVHRCTVKAIV